MVALGLDDTVDLLLHATDGFGHTTSRQRLRCFAQALEESKAASGDKEVCSRSPLQGKRSKDVRSRSTRQERRALRVKRKEEQVAVRRAMVMSGGFGRGDAGARPPCLRSSVLEFVSPRCQMKRQS